MGFDARTGILWASNRRGGTYDILFQINPTTGKFVQDAFGQNIDYVVIDGSGVYEIDGLQNTRWEKVSSSFGEPSSDTFLPMIFPSKVLRTNFFLTCPYSSLMVRKDLL